MNNKNPQFQPFGNNIKIEPESRNKIIGNTAKYFLYGKVIAIGEDVKKINIGDIIGYVLWGIKEIEMSDGTKQYFMQEDSDFILGVTKDEK